MSITEKILCSKTHEYILENSDNTYTIGLTDYAVEQLGDIVFLELPEVGTEYKKGETFATIESVKAASEIYMPISGKIIEVNNGNTFTLPDEDVTIEVIFFREASFVEVPNTAMDAMVFVIIGGLLVTAGGLVIFSNLKQKKLN